LQGTEAPVAWPMTDAFSSFRWRQDGRIAIVEIHRPPVNALTQESYKELREFFSDPDRHGVSAHALVLTGSGKHFCAGNDLSEFETLSSQVSRINSFHAREAFAAIYDCPIPVVGAVHGAALGAGLVIAACCDILVAADDAIFGLPEISVGVAGGAKHLARMVPQNMVRRMFFTAERIDAATMLAFGGVSEVVPPDTLLSTAASLATTIAGHSPAALRMTKRVLNDIEYMDLLRGYELEQAVTDRLADHPDSKEAINASRQKRPANYAPPSRP
jgi:enoyl-CoA hydratase